MTKQQETTEKKQQRKQMFVDFQDSKIFDTNNIPTSFSIKQRNELIETNIKLVDFVIERYFKHHKFNQDAKQEGRIGLLEAVERFEPSKGFQFSTYATPWIYSYVRAFLNKDSLKPKTPSHIEAGISKLRKLAIEQNCPIEDILENSVEVTDKMKKSIGQALKNKKQTNLVSLDLEISEGITFGDTLASPEQSSFLTSDKDKVIKAVKIGLAALPERQRLAVLLRYKIITKEDILITKLGKQQS
jgi:RNA polymerase sigma factor (sigma-70 family)